MRTDRSFMSTYKWAHGGAWDVLPNKLNFSEVLRRCPEVYIRQYHKESVTYRYSFKIAPRLLPRCSSAKEELFWDKRWIQYLTRTYKPWEEERGDAGVQLSSPVWIWKQLPKPVRHFWKTLHTSIHIFVNSNMWVKLPPASDFINRWAHSVLDHGNKNITNEKHHSWGHWKISCTARCDNLWPSI